VANIPNSYYPDSFFDALGRWQRGWRKDPGLRLPIAEQLLSELDTLPSYVREHDGSPTYRKRNLYKKDDQTELVPLFTKGELDEGSPTSWSTSIEFAKKFGPIFDDVSENSVAGAIFEHRPTADEVVLNIPRLWQDPLFVEAAVSYRDRRGAEAAAIFHYRNERDQYEIILRAPLKVGEIHQFGRMTTAEAIYKLMNATTAEHMDVVDKLLKTANIEPHEARYLSPAASARVARRVVKTQRRRVTRWKKVRVPRPASSGRRASLADAFELGSKAAGDGAWFKGWRRLRGRGGLTEGRWSDGTVVWHGMWGHIWLW
jgi:hypothetical protein